MKKAKYIFASILLSTIVISSCAKYQEEVKKDPIISIYVNGEITSLSDIGSFEYRDVPSFNYKVDPSGVLVSDYSFISSKGTDLGHQIPSEVGSYKYRISVDGNKDYNPAIKEVSFSLYKNKLTPTITTYLSINDEARVNTDSLSNISFSQDDVYEFSYVATSRVESDYYFASNTTNLGKVEPTEPGDYKYIVETIEDETYLSATKSVEFTIEAKVVPPLIETADINIFAINDFHGAVEEDEYNDRAGLLKTYSYLKEKRDEDRDTLLLDQGDTWQGSIYSNYNHGALLTDVMNYCEFDARTIGNHDFDWGIDAVEINAKKSYNGYATPTLGANLCDYDFASKTTTETFKDDVGVSKVTTKVLSNGIKVGIVGVIGSDQLTSINSLFCQDFVFIDHVAVIKEQATYLREDLHCDVVICAIHAPSSEVAHKNLGDYVDLVLCGHSHAYEEYYEDDLLFAQFRSYGQCFGNIKLTYNFISKSVTSTSLDVIDYNDLSNVEADPTINSLLNSYSSECDSEANQIIVQSASGNFKASGYLPNVMANAIYDKAVSEGYDVDLAILNKARDDISSSTWKYSHIYQAFPFDNMIYIADVKGSDLIYELISYTNYFYRSDDFNDTTFESNRIYRVACIDYLLFHTNLTTKGDNKYYREYDYFASFTGTYLGVLNKNYREILRDWLISNGYSTGIKTLSSYDFSASYNDHFKKFSSYY